MGHNLNLELVSRMREPDTPWDLSFIHQAADIIEEQEKTIMRLRNEKGMAEAEAQIYRNAARLYGIDAETMLTLAKSQIKTSADNIRIVEKMQEILDIFKYVPDNLTELDLARATTQYDGDSSKPFCDLVFCGLDIIRSYHKKRSEYDELRKGNLSEVL